MFTKNLFIFIIIFSITLWLGGSFALSVLAEETDLEAVLGCTDETAENYNPAATQDDGSCTYPEPEAVLGCTDQEAENYNPEATQDDGSCTYPEPEPAPAQNPNLHPHPHPYPYPHLHLHPHLN